MIRKPRTRLLALSLCAGLTAQPALAECGSASWYELTGRTASGIRNNPEALTAAHRTLPFGTRVKVENLANGETVTLTIIDRGPFARGRVLDVSRRAARELKFLRRGVTKVRVTVAGKAPPSCG